MERRTSFLSIEEGLSELADIDADEDTTCLPQEQFCKNDGREGMPKPYGRGCLHFGLAIFVLPFGFYHFYVEANGNPYALVAGFFYLATNLFCYGISGLYHTQNWPPQTEILLQKFDHCGIALLSCGTMIPVSVLLMNYPYGLLLASSVVTTCAYTCYQIMMGNPSVARQAMVPACLVPFTYVLYFQMTSLEFTCMIMTMLFQVCGMLVFVHEKPNLCHDKYCGFHELFHVFVVCAGICVYICNWSVIHRLCNPSI